MILTKLSDLKPHPENISIYGDSIDEDFLSSVREQGILTPLTITHDNRIISGHRRYLAAKQLGITEVSVEVFKSRDELDILQALIHSNRQRVKTNWQIAREAETLIEIEKQRAAKRKQEAGAAAGKASGVARRGETKVQVLMPEPSKKPQARDEVGKSLGVGGRTVDFAVKTVEIVRNLEEAGEQEKAEEIKHIMNTRGFVPAVKAATKIVEPTPEPEPERTVGSEQSPKLEQVKEYIEAFTVARDRGREFRALVRELFDSEAGCDLKTQITLGDIDRVVHALTSTSPAAIGCPLCDGASKTCSACYGNNWVTRRVYKELKSALPPDKAALMQPIK